MRESEREGGGGGGSSYIYLFFLNSEKFEGGNGRNGGREKGRKKGGDAFLSELWLRGLRIYPSFCFCWGKRGGMLFFGLGGMCV